MMNSSQMVSAKIVSSVSRLKDILTAMGIQFEKGAEYHQVLADKIHVVNDMMKSSKITAPIAVQRFQEILEVIELAADAFDYSQHSERVLMIDATITQHSCTVAEALELHQVDGFNSTTEGVASEAQGNAQQVDEKTARMAIRLGESRGATIVTMANVTAARVVATGQVSDPDLSQQLEASELLLEKVCTGLLVNPGKLLNQQLFPQLTSITPSNLATSVEALPSTA